MRKPAPIQRQNLAPEAGPDLAPKPGPDRALHNRKKPKPSEDATIAGRSDLRNRYAMTPGQLIADCAAHRLKGNDILVFNALGFFAIGTDKASHSTRWLEEQTGLKRDRVSESLKRLAAAGHIEALSVGSRRRICWRLTSPIFGRQQKVVVSDGNGTRTTNRASLSEEYRRWKEKTA